MTSVLERLRLGESPLLAMASGVVPECGPEVTVAAAAAAGFRAVGLRADQTRWSRREVSATRRLLDGEGLALLDLEVIRILPGPPEVEHLGLLDLAVDLGARNVLAVSLDPDAAATAAKLAALAEHLAGTDVVLSLEFMRFTEVRTLAEAASLVEEADQLGPSTSPRLGVLVDLLHLQRSGDSPAALGRLPANRLAYVQVCDAPQAVAQTWSDEDCRREAVDGRCQLGEGSLPVTEFLAGIAAGTPLSVELRSAALRCRFPDPVDRARRVAEHSNRFLAQLGAQ